MSINPVGVVRKIDELGRIVLPMELRKKLEINSGDSMEIFINDNSIMLKKYQSQCLFCGGFDDVETFKNKKICRKCLKIASESLNI